MIKTITRLSKAAALTACVALLFVSCFKMHGKFAYRMNGSEEYRVMPNMLGVSSSTPVEWTYAFDSVYSKKKVSVHLLSKKLVWIGIEQDLQEIEKVKPFVWGEIKELNPGAYKIQIVIDDSLIDEIEFSVYDSDQDDEEDFSLTK